MENNRDDGAVKKQMPELAVKFKEKFEHYLRNPTDDNNVAEMKALRAQIEMLGYSVTALMFLDEKGGYKKLQLMVARDRGTLTRH